MEKVLYIDDNNPTLRAKKNVSIKRFPKINHASTPNNGTGNTISINHPTSTKTHSSQKKSKAIGKDKAVEEFETEKIKSEEKLDNIVNNAPNVLIKTKAIWPFDLFPNSIIVDQTKVDLIYRYLFEQDVFSMLIKKISGVHIHANIFFASLRFEVEGYETNPEPINFLNIEMASKARRIILGLIACDKQGVDITHISPSELAGKMEEIGKAHENIQPLVEKEK